jgi:hypothetical protein
MVDGQKVWAGVIPFPEVFAYHADGAWWLVSTFGGDVRWHRPSGEVAEA